MTKDGNNSRNLTLMIADYMEQGFLDNIIDMFKHDSALYDVVSDLIQDDRVRVRVGVTAMMEELKNRDRANIFRAAEKLLPLLDHPNPVVRGDAANLIGIAGNTSVIPFLEKALKDTNPNVRSIAEEAIQEIRSNLLE